MAAAFAPASVTATQLTWDGGAADNNWGTLNNWNPNQRPVNGDELFFAGTLRTSAVNNLSALVIDRLTFNAGAAAFTLSGNAFTISSNSPGTDGYIQNNSANLQTINNALTFNAGTGYINFLTFPSAGITFNGTITLNAATVHAMGDGTLTFNGVISGAPGITGIGLEAGAPLVLLNAQNTYSGGTLINGASTLRLGASSRIPESSAINLQSGGTLDLNGFTQTVAGLGGAAGTVLLGSGNLQVNIDVSQTFSGTISGAGGKFTKTGTGTLTLSGSSPNNYTGGTEVLAGTLALTPSTNNALGSGPLLVQGGTLNIQGVSESVAGVTLDGGQLTGSGILQGTGYAVRSGMISVRLGGGALTKTTNGTVVLAAANSYTNGTTIAGGTLQLQAVGALPSFTNVVISGGATLDLTSFSQSVQGLTLNDGTITGSGATLTTTGVTAQYGTIAASLAGSGDLLKQGTGTVTLSAANLYGGRTIVDGGVLSLAVAGALPGASALSIGPGALLRLNGFDQSVASLTGPGSIDLGAGTLSVDGSGNLSGVISGSGGLVRQGTGTLLLSGANTYTGQTLVTGGTLQLGNNALADTSSVRVAGGTLDVRQQSDLVGAVSLVSGTIQGTTGLLRSNAGFSVESGQIGARLGGTGALTKTTAGVVTLGNNAIYSGATTIADGVLRLTVANALPTGTAVVISAPGILDLNGNPAVIGSLTGGGTVSLGGATLSVGGNGQSTLFSGTLTGTGASGLVKFGVETLALSNLNQYAGALDVEGGTLALPNGLAASGSAIQVGHGTLAAQGIVNRALNVTFGQVAATGDLIVGDFSGAQGISIQGTLDAGSHVVQLVNNAPVSISGTALLAQGGRLTSFNQGTGITLAPGGTISASGNAFVDGNLLNRGMVAGPSAAGAFLTLTDDVSGDGSYTGNVAFGGKFSGGLSPARISMQNALFDSSSTLVMELAGLTPGTQYDQLAASGTLELHNGSLLVTLLNGFTPHGGEVFDLLDWGTLSGTFGSISLPSLGADLAWNTANLYIDGTIAVAAIPEAEIYLMLAAGLLGLGARRRKKGRM